MLFCGLQLFETMTNFKNISILLASLLLINCAKRTTISGGDKDTIAPKIINSLPKNFSTNFEGNEIKITFDELIKVKVPTEDREQKVLIMDAIIRETKADKVQVIGKTLVLFRPSDDKKIVLPRG